MSLLDPIYDSPAMPRLARELDQAVREETRRREVFRDWLQDDVKAEFINGERIVHSPARLAHTDAMFRIAKILDVHVLRRSLGKIGIKKCLVGMTRNDYEPDVCWWGPKTAKLFTGETMVFPAPDLVVEVLSPSTERRDRGVKFEDYAAHGVAEYWIVDADARVVEQYILRGEVFAELAKWGADSVLRSAAVGGIEVPVAAVFDDAAQAAALERIWRG